MDIFSHVNCSFSFQIEIETKDTGIPRLVYRKTLTISVTDVNEKPTDIIVSFAAFFYFLRKLTHEYEKSFVMQSTV